jgi:hypothetical protein
MTARARIRGCRPRSGGRSQKRSFMPPTGRTTSTRTASAAPLRRTGKCWWKRGRRSRSCRRLRSPVAHVHAQLHVR